MPTFNNSRLLISEEVYNSILVKISEGTWPEGYKIPSENQLCEIFAVSRVSIRAAIQRLQGQGFIITKQGVGSFVSIPPKHNIESVREDIDLSGLTLKEFFEFRQAIEFKAIDLFVVCATDSDLQSLRDAMEGLNTNCDDPEKFMEYCMKFQDTVMGGSKNKYLLEVYHQYRNEIIHYIEQFNKRAGRNPEQRAATYYKIFEALLNKRPSDVKDYIMENDTRFRAEVLKNHK